MARWMVAGAVVAVVATGCAQAPTNYAVVNGDVISAREVNDTVEALNEELAPRGMGQVAQSDIGNMKVLVLLAEDVAEERDITLSGADRNEFIVAQGADQLASAGPAAAAYVDEVTFLSLVIEEIGNDEFQQRVADADVVVNPRYGTWSPDSLIVEGTGGLAQRAPAAPAAPRT